ncbi:MAG: methylcrotonoyl-CoA carboxylase, partial [Elusimicrobia bacterium]|nr:methylcrotonoyl-CoA carboxylase [Elusimicrobiota bacterium]
MSELDADTPPIPSAVDRDSSEFKANQAHHQALLADLEARLARIREGGSKKAADLHRSRGKLTAR